MVSYFLHLHLQAAQAQEPALAVHVEQVLGRDEVLQGSVHQIGLVKKVMHKEGPKGFTGVYLIQVKRFFSTS